MRHRFNVLRISLRAMLVLVALCAIGFRWHREIRRLGRDLIYFPWYRLDDERLVSDESGRTFNIVAFSPDGNILATVGENHGEATLAVWDVAARRLRWESKLPEKNFYDLFLSADGKTAVVVNGREAFQFDAPPLPSTAIRFDLADGRRRSTTSLGPTPIRGVALSPDGNTLAAGTDATENESAGKLALSGSSHRREGCRKAGRGLSGRGVGLCTRRFRVGHGFTQDESIVCRIVARRLDRAEVPRPENTSTEGRVVGY